MIKNKNFIYLLLFFLYTSGFSQSQSLFSKYFVKEKAILVRWVTTDRSLFEEGVKNGYRITRYTKQGENFSEPTVISENLKPYLKTDSVKWNALIKKNENSLVAYKAIYENKISENIPQKTKDKQQSMLFNLMLLSCDHDAEIAKACGLFVTDSSISNTKVYRYTIEINNLPAKFKIAPVTIEVNSATLSQNPTISNLAGKFKNRSVQLKWPTIGYTEFYGGYDIERSTDNLGFKKVNKSPAILLFSQFEKNKNEILFQDTVPETGTNYFYRIRGINFFGERSAPSNVVSGTGYEELLSNPVIDSLKVIENRKVFIHWTMSDSNENRLPKEYILMRSEKDNGKYSSIHSSATGFDFTDESPLKSNYYKIGAVAYSNDTLFSFSKLALILDTIPPIPPTGLKAKSDPKGNVEINWDKNPENDVQGYKIFKANSLTEEFIQINNEFEKGNSFKDKLNLKTLSKKIYYSVVATDNNHNNSELSTPIEVKRPDTISPVPVIIKDLYIQQNGIRSNWIPSSSDDINQYVLYRQDEKSNSDVKIKAWSNTDTITSFVDTTVEFSTGYRYKIIAIDEDDNISISNIPYMFFETGFRKKISDIKFEIDRSKKTVFLKWNYKENEIEKFIIYRAKTKEPLTIIKTILFPTLAFEDNTLHIGNTYEYRIKAVFTNGAESIISDAVRVEY